MFCPNCGQDCGDARFCTGCGTQVQQTSEESAGKNAQSKCVFPDPPFSIKKTFRGYLAFEENSVRMDVKLSLRGRKIFLVPYNEIYDASYVPATNWQTGFLCIRDWKTRNRPIPRTMWEKNVQDLMFWFEKKDNQDFYRAYVFLKKCAVINAQNRIIKRTSDTHQ